MNELDFDMRRGRGRGRTGCSHELGCLHALEGIARGRVVGADAVRRYHGGSVDDPECS